MPEHNNKWYWSSTNPFIKFLRFMNLMEPDKTVLSLSKLIVWVMVGLTVAVLIIDPSNLVAVIGAMSACSITMLNYAYRRHVQFKTGEYHKDIGK